MAGGDGSRQPTALELGVATYQGKYFAEIVKQFVAGKSAV
jgi:NAD(P)H dehydrogenase (quinone)